jgi:hypothetical protein
MVVLYFGCFECIQVGLLGGAGMFALVALFVTFCGLLFVVLNFHELFGREKMADHLQTLLTVVFYGYALTPVIRLFFLL